MIEPEFMSEAQVAAVQRLGKVLASQRGRQWMKQNDYSSGMPIIAAHESEAMVDVLDRIEADGGAPVVLAVHYTRTVRVMKKFGWRSGTANVGDLNVRQRASG